VVDLVEVGLKPEQACNLIIGRQKTKEYLREMDYEDVMWIELAKNTIQ
jgi:hypothetical protein